MNGYTAEQVRSALLEWLHVTPVVGPSDIDAFVIHLEHRKPAVDSSNRFRIGESVQVKEHGGNWVPCVIAAWTLTTREHFIDRDCVVQSLVGELSGVDINSTGCQDCGGTGDDWTHMSGGVCPSCGPKQLTVAVGEPVGWFWRSEFGAVEFRERLSDLEVQRLKAWRAYSETGK